MNFTQIINEIKNKDDFNEFIESLIEDLKHNSYEWENNTLESYLIGIASWIEDMEGYYTNNNIPMPENIDWKVFARILIAAKIYE